MVKLDDKKLLELGLNKKDIIILKLFTKKKNIRIYEIQRKTKYHWDTCKSHCELLVNKKYLIRVKKNVYKLRYGLREGLIDLFKRKVYI